MIDTPLGPVSVLVEDDAVVAITFATVPAPAHPLVDETERQLTAYFAKKLAHFDLPLAPRGTEFEKRVWASLRAIPPGTTTSYGALADALGSVARAVGGANGKNPIAIVVPCHRVIGMRGELTGYAGGLERKRWLLVHEGAILA